MDEGDSALSVLAYTTPPRIAVNTTDPAWPEWM